MFCGFIMLLLANSVHGIFPIHQNLVDIFSDRYCLGLMVDSKLVCQINWAYDLFFMQMVQSGIK